MVRTSRQLLTDKLGEVLSVLAFFVHPEYYSNPGLKALIEGRKGQYIMKRSYRRQNWQKKMRMMKRQRRKPRRGDSEGRERGRKRGGDEQKEGGEGGGAGGGKRGGVGRGEKKTEREDDQ